MYKTYKLSLISTINTVMFNQYAICEIMKPESGEVEAEHKEPMARAFFIIKTNFY